MVIRDQRHANVRKRTTLLDIIDVSPLKWHVFGRGLNRSVHEGMNDISNVKVHLRSRSGNVNISLYLYKPIFLNLKFQALGHFCFGPGGNAKTGFLVARIISVVVSYYRSILLWCRC